MNNENKFGNFLKELRNEQGLSQEELAEKLFVHRTTVNKWEKGIVVPLNDTLITIANFFNISVDELLNGSRIDKNDNLRKIFKSKSPIFKITTLSIIILILTLILFLIYYFAKTYNSTEVYRFYGNNDTIKTKDGLILFANDKMYFKPGNFYNNKNEIINVETIELYTYENNIKTTLLKSDLDNLLVELSNSHELFLNIINKKENLYLDACYEKKCEQITINTYKNYNNDKVIFDDIQTIKGQKAKTLTAEPNIIDQLKKYGFKYDEINEMYYLHKDKIEIDYVKSTEQIAIKINEKNYKIKMSINIKNKSVKYEKYVDNNKPITITIDDYTNQQDPNYNTFKEIYEKFLSTYFQGFI